MQGNRRYQEAEYERTEGQPLSPARLVDIWRGLHERDRLPFVLSLSEDIADKVIALCTAPAAAPAERKTNA